MTAAERNALTDLICTAHGYGIATSEQIAQVASKHDMEPWKLEGFYFDATETAGDE